MCKLPLSPHHHWRTTILWVLCFAAPKFLEQLPFSSPAWILSVFWETTLYRHLTHQKRALNQRLTQRLLQFCNNGSSHSCNESLSIFLALSLYRAAAGLPACLSLKSVYHFSLSLWLTLLAHFLTVFTSNATFYKNSPTFCEYLQHFLLLKQKFLWKLFLHVSIEGAIFKEDYHQ